MLSDFIYYTLLKKGKIIIAIVGLIIAIIVFYYTYSWQTSFKQTMENTVTTCKFDKDCFYECGMCRSVESGQYCEDKGKYNCSCINGKCEISNI